MTRAIIHGERTDDGGVCWWAEIPDQPNYTAASDSLAGVKDLVREFAEIEGWPAPRFELAEGGVIIL